VRVVISKLEKLGKFEFTRACAHGKGRRGLNFWIGVYCLVVQIFLFGTCHYKILLLFEFNLMNAQRLLIFVNGHFN